MLSKVRHFDRKAWQMVLLFVPSLALWISNMPHLDTNGAFFRDLGPDVDPAFHQSNGERKIMIAISNLIPLGSTPWSVMYNNDSNKEGPI